MTRSESLAALSLAARIIRERRAVPGKHELARLIDPFTVAEARSHGLAAVRAIRETSAFPYAPWIDLKAVMAARPAFRAALSAVGITGAL